VKIIKHFTVQLSTGYGYFLPLKFKCYPHYPVMKHMVLTQVERKISLLYKNTGKMLLSYILIFCLERKTENSELNGSKNFQKNSAGSYFLCGKIFVTS
jgi:hypothetical protein